MKGLLVRVAADQSPGGGHWNGPVDAHSGAFTYVPIPETKPNRAGHERPYESLVPVLGRAGASLPSHFIGQRMHLDPDFEQLTYGDRGSKGKQISNGLGSGDLLVFYSGLMDSQTEKLVYAIIGLYLVERIAMARDLPKSEWHRNAHTRRELAVDADDIVVVAQEHFSGRLSRCLPIGDYRDRAYRVRKDLLDEWGDISANNGYLQRSAVFPRLLDPERFLGWFKRQGVELVKKNNLE
jgi:hypothetical protein